MKISALAESFTPSEAAAEPKFGTKAGALTLKLGEKAEEGEELEVEWDFIWRKP